MFSNNSISTTFGFTFCCSPPPSLFPHSSVYGSSTFLFFKKKKNSEKLCGLRVCCSNNVDVNSNSNSSSSSRYEEVGGFREEEKLKNFMLGVGSLHRSRTTQQVDEEGGLNASNCEALLRGGDQVTSVLEEIIKLLEGMGADEKSEEVAVELAAHGVIGQRVDQMEGGFMMALDYMIETAAKGNDDERKSLLEVIKETVLSHLAKKCPPHVQVIGLLCRTPLKESRTELLRRVAAGGGIFKSEKGPTIHLPGANLSDIANQADDILETMEEKPRVPDRKLLARLVLIREEARNMMGGGILDERNDRGLNTLPEAEVNFLSKLVAMRPGKAVQKIIAEVMEGKNEGADLSSEHQAANDNTHVRKGIFGKSSVTGRTPLPVRPGMFLETISKVLKEIYAGNVSGITAQQLEWVHHQTLQILQDLAFQ